MSERKDVEEKLGAVLTDILYDALEGESTPIQMSSALGTLGKLYIDTQSSLEKTRELMNARQDYTDLMRRRIELIGILSDHSSERALSSEQLEDIAKIVWPSDYVTTDVDVLNTPLYPLSSDPTKTPTPDNLMLMASGLLWNAHHLFNALEKVVTGLVQGDLVVRGIKNWRVQCDGWRRVTGVEKFETEEMKGHPL